MQKIILYSTLACHLCDIAEEIIADCIGNSDFFLEKVDIADDPELLKKYGVSIPVLYLHKTAKELFWPFDGDAVNKCLVEASA